MGALSGTTTHMVAGVENLWPAAGEVPTDTLDQLVLASRLLGANRAVANFGGGNTSAKGTTIDHAGREVRTLWVKGSGSDLATMERRHVTALRMDEVEPLMQRDAMTDEEMVAYLGRCMLDPAMPRGSIETLLHAFIPAAHVHHTHPDGINVIASTVDGERMVGEIFGARAAWIPYIRPGFTLAKQVGEAVRANPDLELVVLAKHGLVVWGESAQEAYSRTIDVINEAVAWVNERTAGQARFGGPAAGAGTLDDAGRRALLDAVLPAIRGAVSSERHKLLTVDTSEAASELVSSQQAPELTQVGAACPDHLVRTKRVPLWVPFDPRSEDAAVLAQRVRELAAAYRDDYRAYVAGNADEATVPGDPDARVVLIQHVGLVSAATTRAESKLSRDLYHRAIEVMAGAQALGGFTSLTASESFAVEYWPLELYKLSLAPPAGELQGQVALVTGAAGGIGRAVVDLLSAAGAAVIAFDLDGDGAMEAVSELGENGVAVAGDVTSEAAVADAYRAAVRAYGGVDIVVSNAGIASSAPIEGTTLAEWERQLAVNATGAFLCTRAVLEGMKERDRGRIVTVASVAAVHGSRYTAGYTASKHAALGLVRSVAAEVAGTGITCNAVCPAYVRSDMTTATIENIETRTGKDGEAALAAMSPLGRLIEPSEVAFAVRFFAAPEAGAINGQTLIIDGGGIQL